MTSRNNNNNSATTSVHVLTGTQCTLWHSLLRMNVTLYPGSFTKTCMAYWFPSGCIMLAMSPSICHMGTLTHSYPVILVAAFASYEIS